MLALSLFMRNAERPTSFAAPNTEIFNCFLTYLPGWCFKYFIRICFPSYKVSIDLHGPCLYCLIIRWSNQRMGNGEQVNQYCYFSILTICADLLFCVLVIASRL